MLVDKILPAVDPVGVAIKKVLAYRNNTAAGKCCIIHHLQRKGLRSSKKRYCGQDRTAVILAEENIVE